MTTKTVRLYILFFGLLFIMTGCEKKTQEREVLKIAEQFGLAYAPLQIMRCEKLIEKELEGIEIKWVRLGNAAAIREAVLSGNVDIGFMGIPPFLIGRDRGMEWKLFTGLSSAPVGLVTWKTGVEGIKDLGPSDRIALPQPGSIQHILLAMAAGDQLDDPSIFDNQLVAMSHPDGMTALLSKSDISAHFTSPPYIMKELQREGMRLILDGTEAMGGPYTFIAGVATEELLATGENLLRGFMTALNKSIDMLSLETERGSALLAGEYSMPEKEILSYITWDGMSYGTEILGLQKFIRFMAEQGYLKNGAMQVSDIFHKIDIEDKK